jgi:hypothetical protein
VSLGERTRVITLELSKLEYLVDKGVGEMSAAERWAFYFRYMTDKSKQQKMNLLALKGEVSHKPCRFDEVRSGKEI